MIADVGKGASGMTIKKRLFFSNILMIVVPAAVVTLIGLLCMGLLWLALQSGGSMRLEDGEDLTHIGRGMAKQIQGFMADTPGAWTSQMSGLETMTRSGVLRIVVMHNGGLAYTAGTDQPADPQLAQAAASLDGPEAFISAGGTQCIPSQQHIQRRHLVPVSFRH